MRYAIIALACLLALAAKPVPSGSLEGPTGDIRYGGTVTFQVEQDARSGAILQVLAIKDGSVVYGDNVPDPHGAVSFTLGSPQNGTSVWDGGPASCRADLYVVSPNGDILFLDAVTFEVG